MFGVDDDFVGYLTLVGDDETNLMSTGTTTVLLARRGDGFSRQGFYLWNLLRKSEDFLTLST